MKKVYTCFCTDFIHDGHLNIIREARKYGEVIVGVLSDKAMIKFNKFPTISFEERMALVKDIKGVSDVIVQEDVMYDKIFEEIKPDYVIHGDNWCSGPMKAIRDNVVKLTEKFGGTVIDVPYTRNEKVNLKYKGDYNEFRQDNSKRKITVSDMRDLNKKRISSEYSRFQIQKKITNKY